jgi:hypothetical protein
MRASFMTCVATSETARSAPAREDVHRIPRARPSCPAFGVTNVRTFVSSDDPTKVAVLMDVPDLEALKAGLGGPELVAAMENDGVVPETLRVLVEG